MQFVMIVIRQIFKALFKASFFTSKQSARLKANKTGSSEWNKKLYICHEDGNERDDKNDDDNNTTSIIIMISIIIIILITTHVIMGVFILIPLLFVLFILFESFLCLIDTITFTVAAVHADSIHVYCGHQYAAGICVF